MGINIKELFSPYLIQRPAHINRLFSIFTQILGTGSGPKVMASPEAIGSLNGNQTDLLAAILTGERFQVGKKALRYTGSLGLRGDYNIVDVETILSGWLGIAAIQACGLFSIPGMGQTVANDLGTAAGNQTTGWAQFEFGTQHGLIFRLERVIGFGLEGQDGGPIFFLDGANRRLWHDGNLRSNVQR